MIARPGQTGWQTILADLSLILFMITASALSVAEAPHPASAAPKAAAPRPVTPSARAEPVGVWREGEGAPPLANWLAEQGSDPRLRLSIVVRYLAGEGRREAALDRAAALAAQAGVRGASARLVVEPGAVAGASATLGYDRDGD
jgi:hypothetical protein